MNKQTMMRWSGLLALTSGLIAACGSGSGTDATTSTNTATTQPAVQPANFVAAGLKSAITTVSCTLSGGTATTCYQIVTVGAPSEHAVGPFCPTNVYSDVANKTFSTDASVGGIWIESGKTYDLTGAFIANLATFYNDSAWKLFDASTGKVNVTDTQAAFEAAAQVQIPLAYNNYCVEGQDDLCRTAASRAPT